MAKKSHGRTFVSAGISIDPETLQAAQERAKKLRMKWSEYVRRCIEAELGRDHMVIRPKTED